MSKLNNNILVDKNVWDFLDTIECIHLPHRTDRRITMDALKNKLKMPLQIFNAQKSLRGAVQGCFESHQTIMKKALKNGLSNALIFEDDAEISEFFSIQKIKDVKQFMKNATINWDIIYLGCFPDVWKHSQSHITKSFYEVKATQTHAYIVNKPYMNFFSNLIFQGVPIDEVFLKTAKAYAILPSLFKQSLTPSDVSSIAISNLPFKNVMTSLVENYAMYFGLFPISHACIYTFFCIFLLCVVKTIYKIKKKYS